MRPLFSRPLLIPLVVAVFVLVLTAGTRLLPGKEASAFYTYLSQKSDYERVTLSYATSTIEADVVVSPDALQQGLSGREVLEEGEGMLFVFKESARHGIWMKEMRFPIDIIWLNEALRVVHFEERVAPETYPAVFRPEKHARYVLEVPAGAVEAHGIAEGRLFHLEL